MYFSVRIVNLDFYMCSPIQGLDVMYSEFRGSSVNQVPVLRLFGSTGTGEKICVHIHGVFPYLYIPYDGIEEVNGLMYKIAGSVDKAINISLNQASSNTQHVYKISLVSGIPMYGYHSKAHQFFKIYLYNPLLIKKVSNLLLNETTLGRIYQPHETHLNFTLQFMIDYNLHGMSNMITSKMNFRLNPNRPNSDLDSELFLPPSVCKMTVCELEGDVLADCIVNREEVTSGHIAANPGIATLWADEMQRRRNKGETSQIEHLLELSRTAAPTKSHVLFKQALTERLAALTEEQSMDTLNLSVYPAETPENANIQNASLADSQLSSSLDETITDLSETVPSNVIMDEDALKLLDILNNLGDGGDEPLEDDSILSQTIRKEEEDIDLDLSMPLEVYRTPQKIIPTKEDSGESEDELNKTLVPQLDGEAGNLDEFVIHQSAMHPAHPRCLKTIDEMVECFERKNDLRKHIKKTLFVKVIDVNWYSNKHRLPEILEKSSSVHSATVFKTSVGKEVVNKVPKCLIIKTTTNKKPVSLRTKRRIAKIRENNLIETQIRKLAWGIRKINRKNQIFAVMKKLHEKEKKLCVMMDKNCKPLFNVVSCSDLKAPYKVFKNDDSSKINIISDLVIRTARYVEPTLHFTLRAPNHSCYLYHYSGQSIEPNVTPIPKKICKQKINRSYKSLDRFIKNNLKNDEGIKKHLWKSNSKYKKEKFEENKENVMIEKVYEFEFMNVNGNDFNDFQENKSSLKIKNTLDNLQSQLKHHMEYLKIPSYSHVKQEPFESIDFWNSVNDSAYSEKEEIRDLKSFDTVSEIFPSPFHQLSASKNKLSNVRMKHLKIQLRRKDVINVKNEQLQVPLRRSARINSPTYVCKARVLSNCSCSHCYDEKPTKKIENITKKNEKTIINTHLSLDGTMDSSSSDEDDKRPVNNKKTKSATSFDKYSALPISIVKSPKKSSKKSIGSLSESQNLDKTSEEGFRKAEKTFISQRASVTRQLDFSDTPLHTTLVEEKLVCNFSPSKTTSSSKIAVDPTIPIHELLEGTIESEESFGSDSMFNSDDENPKNISFFCSQPFSEIVNDELTAAEKYDKETNYLAKEGTSKILTPKESSQEDKLKIQSSSEGSNFGLITPYQKSENEKESATNVRKECDHSDESNTLFSSGSNQSETLKNVSISINVTDTVDNYKRPDLNKFKAEDPLNYVEDRYVIIAPVKKPPTVQEVNEWIKKNLYKEDVKQKLPSVEKVKIYIPLSPGANADDMNLSLSLTPCTPTNSQDTVGQRVESTPKSSKTSESSTSPLLGLNRKQRKKKLKDKKISKLLLKQLASQNSSGGVSQITGVTINNTYGFDASIDNLKQARPTTEHQHLTTMIMELHISTRGDFKPDPALDSIQSIFYSILNDVPEDYPKTAKKHGIIAVNVLPAGPGINKIPILDGMGIDCDVIYVESEENLLKEFLKLMDYWDPDIIAGYEIEMLSWGYLVERGFVLGMNMKLLLGRILLSSAKVREDDLSNELRIVGRIVLDVWRLMRHEIALQSYTFESVVYHILHKRVPYFCFKDLTFWWNHRSNLYRHRVVSFYLLRVVTILELFDKLDVIGRTSELARLFGILFYEVLSRGSQFRVESMMLRLAKPLNFIPVSPSVQQRARMKAPEYIPLVLEPESKLYLDPVIILDFQSLYPSIIIAYNYCFTTCIGRVQCLGKNTPFEFGATQLKISKQRVEKLVKKDLLNFSPCGIGFVKKEVRDGIMPRMLREILDTRLMVKNAMKENKDDRILQKVLHNRQLGLKLIANVTYGYTAANFSGRMPSVEIGDSVVSKGRETLQRAIEMVDSTVEWGARVVYGDTDSLFVMVPGKSREYAFEVGKKIADAVTKANPDPIKLKLEKVYQPCILQTKKRYVGYMYESPEQKDPVYDAKGIETVRRDGCPAVSKILEKCLRILFETNDVDLVKKYALRQFHKIIAGRASIQDLTFAKEYRGASGYRPGACVPALELTRKWTAVDKRHEPRSGERVPYIIVNGPPGLPLIRLVRSPRDLLNDPSLRPNATYYITKAIIPAVNRCFNLIGIDLNIWFNQMPRKQIQYLPTSVSPMKKSTISHYFSIINCVACSEQSQQGICEKCCDQPQITMVTLMEKLKNWEKNYENTVLICQSCTLSLDEVKCMSLDCPVIYRRIQTGRDVQQSSHIRQLLNDFLYCENMIVYET